MEAEPDPMIIIKVFNRENYKSLICQFNRKNVEVSVSLLPSVQFQLVVG